MVEAPWCYVSGRTILKCHTIALDTSWMQRALWTALSRECNSHICLSSLWWQRVEWEGAWGKGSGQEPKDGAQWRSRDPEKGNGRGPQGGERDAQKGVISPDTGAWLDFVLSGWLSKDLKGRVWDNAWSLAAMTWRWYLLKWETCRGRGSSNCWLARRVSLASCLLLSFELPEVIV